jgi:hypothetical protein
MKKLALLLLVFALMIGSTAWAGHSYTIHSSSHTYDEYDNKVDIDMEDGSILITNEDDDVTVEITEDHELLVDDDGVSLDAEQQKLVAAFYTEVVDIREQGIAVGWEGAKIGMDGAKLGAKAIGRLIKMLLTRYDEDDMERDMERDADKIEVKAELLEVKAEVLEKLAHQIEEHTFELFDTVDELKELDWF